MKLRVTFSTLNMRVNLKRDTCVTDGLRHVSAPNVNDVLTGGVTQSSISQGELQMLIDGV